MADPTSYVPDGETLATAGTDKLIKLWDWDGTVASEAASLKDHIDALVVLGDCSELHDRYVQATLANAAVTQRYGSGTADLLEYIFLASDAVGCYG